MNHKLTPGQFGLFAVGLVIAVIGVFGVWSRFSSHMPQDLDQHKEDLRILNDPNLGAFDKRTAVLRLAKRQHRRAYELGRAWLESENETIRILGFQVMSLSSLPEDFSQVLEYYKTKVSEEKSQVYLRLMAQGYMGDPRMRELAKYLEVQDPIKAFDVYEALYHAGDDKKRNLQYFIEQAESQNSLHWQKARLFLLESNYEPRMNFETLLDSFQFKVLEQQHASRVIMTLARRAKEFESSVRLYSHLRPNKVWYIESALIDSLIVGCPRGIGKIVDRYLTYKDDLEERGLKRLISSLLRMNALKNMESIQKIGKSAANKKFQFEVNKMIERYKALSPLCP